MFFVAFVDRRNYRFAFQAASSFSVHNAALQAVEREKMTTQPPSGTIWKSGRESLRDRGSSPSQVGKIRLRAKPKGQIRRETILVLLKPDCLVACHCGDVLKRFEQADLEIVGCKMTLLSDRVLTEHYAHVYNRPFYPALKSYMQSSPVIALALAGHNAVAQVRDLMGPTDSRKAAKGTIRGDYGKNATTNVVHGSDSPKNSAAEIERFFTDNQLFDVTPRKALAKMKRSIKDSKSFGKHTRMNH